MHSIIDYNTPWWWITKDTREFLSRDYLVGGQTAEERLLEMALACEAHFREIQIEKSGGLRNLNEDDLWWKHEEFMEFLKMGAYSLPTPTWCNAGNDRGLPISCFGANIQDTMEDILDVQNEVGMQTKTGGGTSAFFGNIRPRGSKIGKAGGASFGSVHFMNLFNTTIQVVSQSNVRRGAFAAYLPIEHPDVEEFLKIKSKTPLHPIQDIFPGITITDEWMKSMIAGDKDKRRLWKLIVQKKFNSGLPYIVFVDTINRNKPDVYQFHNMMIVASNLCTEIALPSSADESFVCNLGSMMDLMFHKWKDTQAVRYLVWFMDWVQTDFINKAKKIRALQKCVKFATRHRALGIGRLGWHSCLQNLDLPYDSMEAKFLNVEIQATIKKQAYEASKEMFEKIGASDLMEPFGRRHSTLLAIAPTLSSAFIHGQVSPGTQPWLGVIYIENNAKGKWTVKNPHFAAVLRKHGQDKKSVWKSCLEKGGSCQHLDFLTEHEKRVYRIWGELSQKEVAIQAAMRQPHIDQTQSTNFMVHPKVSQKDVSDLMIFCWEQGIPTLYYQYNTNPAQEHQRNFNTCESCSG